MKKLIVLLAVVAVVAAALIFHYTRPEPNIMADPRIEKFAEIQAEIEIEAEKHDEDTSQLGPVKDSIYENYGVNQQWIDQVTAEIDRHPEDWVQVYDLMIAHAEQIKDSLQYKTHPPNDSD